MAGLFSFFDFTKEGPGVSKNGPKKKTFIVFFEIFFRNFWKFISVNSIYSLLSLLIVTNGFAKVGITHVARNTARDRHSFGLSDYIETIRKNWKQSLAAGIINLIVYGFLIFDIYFFNHQKGAFGIVGVGIILAMLITFTMMNYYVWTLMVTFSYTLKQIYSISFKLAFLNFKKSFLCLFINILLIAVGIGLLFLTGKGYVITMLFEMLIIVFVYPAFSALLIQFCTFDSIKKFIIDPYYKAHPDEDIEKRRRLGLEIEEPEVQNPQNTEEIQEDDGVIFED